MKNRWHSSVGKLIKGSMTSDINVTPLVDVCLVLLIIFMVVTPMLQKGVPVNLPVTEGPERTPDTEKQLQISVRSDGSVYLGPTVIRKDQVESELKTIHDRTPDRDAIRASKHGQGSPRLPSPKHRIPEPSPFCRTDSASCHPRRAMRQHREGKGIHVRGVCRAERSRRGRSVTPRALATARRRTPPQQAPAAIPDARNASSAGPS